MGAHRTFDAGEGPMHTTELDGRWQQVAILLSDHADVLQGRAEPPVNAGFWQPEWAAARDWAQWLLALPEAAVWLGETQGLWAVLAEPGARREAPPDLVRMALLAERALQVPELSDADAPQPRWPGIKARKAAQVAGFASALAPLMGPQTRVVDFGAGHGHLTAHLALAFGVDAVGLDRDPALVARSSALHGGQADGPKGVQLRFVAADLLAESGLDLGAGDVVVALHACGPLCDRALHRAAEAGAAVGWASCCLHRFGAAGWRPSAVPLSGAPSPCVPPEALGLGNLALGEQGIEASRAENLAARERRRALWHLLAARNHPVEAGAELAGLNRRRAHEPLESLANQVFSKLGLSAPLPAELEDAARQARIEAHRTRRLELPRAALGRLFELAVNLDRARNLSQRGLNVAWGTVFEARHSPRNLGGIAWPR
jgi:SAM-dependent methyltransferase